MPLAKIKEEKKKELQPNFTPKPVVLEGKPVKVEEYAGVRSGEKAVGFGAGAKRALDAQPSVSQIADKANEILVDPLTAPFREAGKGFGAIKGDIQDANYQQRQTLGQNTPENDLAFAQRSDARFPDAQGLPTEEEPDLKSAVASGQTLTNIPNELQHSQDPKTTRVMGREGVFTETPGEDFAQGKDYTVGLDQGGGGSGRITVHGGGRLRGGQGFGAVRNSGTPYEIDNSSWSPEEAARFNRKPVHGGTRMVSGALRERLVGGTVRPQRGWSPSYSGSGRTQVQENERMPRFTAPGFTGKAAAARIHSQEQQWLKERRKANDVVNLQAVAQQGMTTREAMQNATALKGGAASIAAKDNRATVEEEGRNTRFAGAQETERERIQNKSGITPQSKLKFSQSVDEEYAKYLGGRMPGQEGQLSKQNWISRTYDPGTLAGYGYQSAAPKNGEDVDGYIDGLL